MDDARLGRAFFTRPTVTVAEALIGCRLVRRTDGDVVGGRIVETEAYGGPDDPASHAALYPRSRAAVMASRPGTVYVYRSYGVHACFNIVSKPEGGVGAVLIRAVEPTTGVDLMRLRRGASSDRDLCRGPGRVAQAFVIDLDDSLTDIVERDDLWVEPALTVGAIARSTRIGITRAVDREWRFFEAGSPFVSGARRKAA